MLESSLQVRQGLLVFRLLLDLEMVLPKLSWLYHVAR